MICRDRIYEKKDRAAADVYILVKDFVESGKYSRCRRASELITMQLRGYNDRNIAERYNISAETVRVERRQISNELWSIFGIDFFDRLLNYKENKEYCKRYDVKAGMFCTVDIDYRASADRDLQFKMERFAR